MLRRGIFSLHNAPRVWGLNFSRNARGIAALHFSRGLLDSHWSGRDSNGFPAQAHRSFYRSQNQEWTPAPVVSAMLLSLVTAAGCTVSADAATSSSGSPQRENRKAEIPEPDSVELINWSSTHTVSSNYYYQPETLDDLKRIVAYAHKTGQKIRPVGSALSPNGLGFESGGMVNLALMDSIISVDKERMEVTVEAGMRVAQVVEALRPHELTLQNYASITEQQIGGLIQVGAHGTGAHIPPIDEQVVAMKIITPAAGELVLSEHDEDPSLFRLARTAFGMLGVVAEVTLKCIPAHRLEEITRVVSRKDVRKHHQEWLARNKHLRYMWIPHTDDVVVVTCNPVVQEAGVEVGSHDEKKSENNELVPAQNLLLEHPNCKLLKEKVVELSFTELRDELLQLDPLNVDWVKKVNAAEAQFWRLSQGSRIGWSDEILQFDCGGQQWVSEVAFPVPQSEVEPADIKYVENVLKAIESQSIPAPAPIEQRWSSASSSPMSPVGEKPSRELEKLYSWVGIIMYLPNAIAGDNENTDIREGIRHSFRRYKLACEKFWPEFRAVEHWAKIEPPSSQQELLALHLRMNDKYSLEAFNAIRSLFDPKGILTNDLLKVILEGGTIVKGDLLASSGGK